MICGAVINRLAAPALRNAPQYKRAGGSSVAAATLIRLTDWAVLTRAETQSVETKLEPET